MQGKDDKQQTGNKRIMMFVDWFEPGFKAGGLIRSCVNVAYNLRDHFDLFVITTNHDFGSSSPYINIVSDQWITHEAGFKIFYASPHLLRWRVIKQQVSKLQPDVIYLNSMYSLFFSIYPLLMKKMRAVQAKVILAPRGMLRQSALQFKRKKKMLYLSAFRLLGLHKNIIFHATEEGEYKDIKNCFGQSADVLLVNDFPGKQSPLQLPTQKQKGQLAILFVGRIHPIKNVDYFLSVLKNANQSIRMTVIGGIEDQSYWNICMQLIREWPQNVSIDFKGELPHREVEQHLLLHHLFVLPTKGENFGHAIFEALAAGRPVLISDQTPWRNLAQYQAGWDLPLDQPGKFSEVVERFAAMDEIELNAWCVGAWQHAKDFLDRSHIKEQYIRLFTQK